MSSTKFEYLSAPDKVLMIKAWTKTVVVVMLGLALAVSLVIGAACGFPYLWHRPSHPNPLQLACQAQHGNWGYHANALSCFFKENG